MSTRSPNEIHVAEAVADSVRSSIRTLVPAKIVSYDPLRRRATVQPSIRYRRPDGVVEDIPPIPSRPVGLPFGGGWIVSFELSPGDEVALAVFDRNVEGWLARGGIVDAPDARMLQLSDCMAIPMLWSSSRAPKTNLPGEMVIGRDDGTARVRISKAGTIKIEGTSVSLKTGAPLGSFLQTLQTAMTTWVPVAQDGGAALKTALAAWLAQTPPGP